MLRFVRGAACRRLPLSIQIQHPHPHPRAPLSQIFRFSCLRVARLA